MKFLKVKWFSLIGVTAVLFIGLSMAGDTLSQQQAVKASLLVSNDRCKGGVQILQIAFLKDGFPIHLSILVPGVEIPVGTKKEFSFELKEMPTFASIKGTIERQRPFEVNVPAGKMVEYPCGTIELRIGVPVPPPEEKPIYPGQSLDQVLQTLQLRGVSIRIEGSLEKPKLGDVSEPMLLRAIPGLSAQLIWASSPPGTLRSVITWDNPAVDLDLIVFGFPWGGFCFQLTPPGILAETCDRPPWGPVPGMAFAVLIINWSLIPQAYVLSLSP